MMAVAFGPTSCSSVLVPKIVAFIAQTFCIDIE